MQRLSTETLIQCNNLFAKPCYRGRLTLFWSSPIMIKYTNWNPQSRRKRKLSPSEAGDSNNSLSVSIDNESISSGSGACGGPPSGGSGGPSGVSSGPSGAKAAKVQPSPSISGSIISNCNSELGNLLWVIDNWSGACDSICYFKVHVFWEGHKNWQNLNRQFDSMK